MRRILDLFRAVGQYLAERRINAYASSCAYFLFMSLVPMTVLACSILPYTTLTQEALLDWISQIVSEDTAVLLAEIAGDVYDASAAVLPVSLVLTLWSAAKAFSAMIRGISEVCGSPRREPYLVLKFRAMLYTVAMLVAMVLSLSLLLFWEKLLGLAQRTLPQMVPLLSVLQRSRMLGTLLLLTLLFSGIYTLAPKDRPRFYQVLPGALGASVAWVALARLFSWGVNLTGGYGAYGSMTTIVLVLLWLYFSMYLLLLCGVATRLWTGRRGT